MGLVIDEDRLSEVLDRLLSDGSRAERHVTYTRQKYRTIYGITPRTIDANLEMVFEITIRQHGGPPTPDRYANASAAFDSDRIRNAKSHQEARQSLSEVPGVGPKIADEYLRKVAHAFRFEPDWVQELYVPLDTHVTEALVRTGCIHEKGGTETSRNTPTEVFNFNSNGTPRVKLTFHEMQNAFKRVANEQGTIRIVFDELWSENRYYLSIPEFREKSCLSEFL